MDFSKLWVCFYFFVGFLLFHFYLHFYCPYESMAFFIFKCIQSISVVILAVAPKSSHFEPAELPSRWFLGLSDMLLLLLNGFFSFWTSQDIPCISCIFLASDLDLAIPPGNPNSGCKLN